MAKLNQSSKPDPKTSLPHEEEESEEEEEKNEEQVNKWPGWPGYSVFRLIVPILKVGGIIGRKGELIKKLCEETKARVRVLDGPIGSAERLVLVSGKEEPELEVSPAMEAVLRLFRNLNGISELGSNGASAVCAIRLLIPQPQAVNLIGKQGASIKSMQESSGAAIRVITPDERPYYVTEEERIVEIQGETGKVEIALKAVIGHLRKFLLDHSIVPLFEKTLADKASASQTVQQQQQSTPQIDRWGADVAPSQPLIPMKRDALFFERDLPVSAEVSRSVLSVYGRDPLGSADVSRSALSALTSARTELSLYGREPAVSDEVSRSVLSVYGPDPLLRSARTEKDPSLISARTELSLYGRDPGSLSSYSSRGPLVTQVTQTMQIPLIYAEDVIGVAGNNVAYIRAKSGATVKVQESRAVPDEIMVEIKGSADQVQSAQQLLQDLLAGHKKAPLRSSYDSSYRTSYSQYSSSSSYPAPSHSSYYGSNGSPKLGGSYSGYRY